MIPVYASVATNARFLTGSAKTSLPPSSTPSLPLWSFNRPEYATRRERSDRIESKRNETSLVFRIREALPINRLWSFNGENSRTRISDSEGKIRRNGKERKGKEHGFQDRARKSLCDDVKGVKKRRQKCPVFLVCDVGGGANASEA